MKKAILARAFRGELGTNNPAEESVLELLKKNGVGTFFGCTGSLFTVFAEKGDDEELFYGKS